MRDLRLKHFALIISLILLSCQDTDIESKSLVDTDMEQAIVLADDYLATSRTEATDLDVTVIKYSSDLTYKTNTITNGYDVIEETTVTAVSKPGGYIFWFAGGGVKYLHSIEMDEASAAALGNDLPFEVIPGDLWALWIPLDILEDVKEDEEFHLKYDIVYTNKEGDIIRLDPKIQIPPMEDSEE